MSIKKLARIFLFKSAQEMPVRLSFELDVPDSLMVLADVFDRNGEELYIVGGAVRDALQGKEPKDFDVATGADPDRVIEIVNQLDGFKVLEVGKAFGIVVVIAPDKEEYEIATFRKDIGAGRRPDSVEFTSIEEDVKRRDLSINALFYDIKRKEVVDYVGGIEDLKNGVVKAVGSASERFSEDPLRIMRVVRFASKDGAKLDQKTYDAIKENNDLSGVSKERIRDELIKSIKSAGNINDMVSLISDLGLWSEIFPGLSVNTGPINTNDPVLVISMLLRDNRNNIGKILNSLKYTSNEANQVSFLISFQNLDVDTAYMLKKQSLKTGLTDEQLRLFGNMVGIPPNLVNALINFELSVKGSDVQGFKGPEMGREIARLETERFKEYV